MKTPLIYLFALISVLASLLYLSGCATDTIGLQPLPDTIEEELQKAVYDGFDGIIVYVDQGEQASSYSAGWKNREKQIPADPQALFKIASISKLYIAAATTKLIVSEQLSLDQTLAELIPEVVGRIEYADEISLKMMLQHRSGLIDYSFEPEVEGETYEDYLSFAARIFDKPSLFKPNKKYAYSNTNYLLIGEILDRTLGYSHHDYIHNEILMPLGLTNTYSVYSQVDSNEVMSGYLVDWEPDVKSWDFPLPGGSMVATAEDVGLFLRALIDGTLFTEKEQAIYSSVYEYEHTGWLPGYTSIARYHPDIDAVVVQFVNTSANELFWLRLTLLYGRLVQILERNS
ncbi:MAG: serine hydrolase domain-containing protein [Bacteroidota bacterium]